jgi:hypothetical protein
MAATGNFTPATALGAIDKNGFRATPRANAGVAFGLWVVTDIRGQQIAQQRILHDAGKDWPWHNHQPLAGETFKFFETGQGVWYD